MVAVRRLDRVASAPAGRLHAHHQRCVVAARVYDDCGVAAVDLVDPGDPDDPAAAAAAAAVVVVVVVAAVVDFVAVVLAATVSAAPAAVDPFRFPLVPERAPQTRFDESQAPAAAWAVRTQYPTPVQAVCVWHVCMCVCV